MIPKKPAPDLIRGGRRFSEKIIFQQEYGGSEVRIVLAAGPTCGLLKRPLDGSIERKGVPAQAWRSPGGCGDLDVFGVAWKVALRARANIGGATAV
jgi:hypothetical protein